MIRTLIPLSVAASMALTGFAFAQENNDSGTGLDLGQAGPRVGEQYVKQESGPWNISCIKAETGEDPCAMVQLLDGPGDEPIAEETIGKLPEGNAAVAWANVIVPLETLLQGQLAMSIDGAPRKLYNYHHCIPLGCVAQLGLTQGDIDAMRSGSLAILSLVPARAPDQVLDMEMSLTGFTAAFDQIGVSLN